MPYYNIEVTRWATVRIEADNEQEALRKAASVDPAELDDVELKSFGLDEDLVDED